MAELICKVTRQECEHLPESPDLFRAKACSKTSLWKKEKKKKPTENPPKLTTYELEEEEREISEQANTGVLE